MSEEELKAIEGLKNIKKHLGIDKQEMQDKGTYKFYEFFEQSLDTVLNLITKQQKEVETLQADLHDMTLSNEHKKKEWIHKDCLNSYVSKDKIRDKIKEVEMHIDGVRANRYTIRECMAIREVLKSIIGEE